MAEIITDKSSIWNQKISTDSILKCLGEPLDTGDLDFSEDKEDKIIDWINQNYNFIQNDYEEIRYKFVKAKTYNTEEESNNLDREMSFTIYCKEDYNDCYWTRDSYIEVNGNLYYISDGCLAETDFFDWRHGWTVWPVQEKYNDDPALDDIINKLSPGMSNCATRELEKLLYNDSEFVWSDRYDSFVARLEDIPYIVKLYPCIY